jgi:hypothetical protein
MMNQAKIQLSLLEMELVTNAGWILTKNNILDKAMMILGSVQDEQQAYLRSSNLPAEVVQTSARISKGEKYRGLPYLVLDQPRFFSKENIFAIRHLFWWGNFFSSTLHLSGNYKVQYAQKIISAFELLKKEGFFVCINTGQWEHHFEEGNFIPVADLSSEEFEKVISGNSFIKLARKIPLEEWDHAARYLPDAFRLYLSLLKD